MWYRNTDTTYNSIIITQPRMIHTHTHIYIYIYIYIYTNAHARTKSPQWNSSVRRLRTALVIKAIKCFWRLLLRNTNFSKSSISSNSGYRSIVVEYSFYDDHGKLHIGTRNYIHARLPIYHRIRTSVALAVDCGSDLFQHAGTGYRPWIGQIKTSDIS